jgi:thioredoxin 1
MLLTKLKHIESGEDHKKAISENENVMVICGRMDSKCIPVFGIIEELEDQYSHIKFYDIEFDKPVSQVIRSIPEVQRFQEIPFTVYYKNGTVARAISNVHNKDQITSVLDEEFASTAYSHSWYW